MYFQVRRGPLGAVGSGLDDELLKNLKHLQFAGIIKNRITTRIAGVASLILLKEIHILIRDLREILQCTYTLTPRSSGHPDMKPGARKKNKNTADRNRKATHFS